MGAQLKQLLGDKITNVHRVFETTEGEYELDLNVRHKRITTEIQLELQKVAESELRLLSESLDRRKEMVRKAQMEGENFNLENLPVYTPRNITCLQLEILVIDLDIVDEKKKPLKPTYDNLAALPAEVRDAIKEEIDASVLPKKKLSTTSANGMRREVNEELGQVG